MTRFARPHLRAAFATGMLLTVGACGGMGRARNPFAGSRASAGGEIRIRVENLNFGDATIHALRAGERIRLGQVTGKSEKSFTVKWNFSLPIEFRVNLIGGGACGVRPLSVDPGDRVWVRIPNALYAGACIAGKG